MTDSIIIYPFTQFQIGFLRGLFRQEDAPPPHNAKVTRIARADNGSVWIEYFSYGQPRTVSISKDETNETYYNELLSKL